MELIFAAIVVTILGGDFVAANPCYFWPGAEYYGKFCYYIVRIRLNWTDAASACRQLTPAGKLAEPASEDHMLFIRQMTVVEFRDVGTQTVWIGGVRDNVTHQLVWASSGHVITTMSWGPLQPNNVNNGENCVGLEHDAVNDVHDFKCVQLKYYMCEHFVGNPCEQSYPGGGHFWDGYCFEFHDVLAVWSDAQARCGQEKAILAEPYTDSLFKFVQSMARSQAGVKVVVPSKPEKVDMVVHNWTLTGKDEIRFAVQACSAASVVLSPVNYVKSSSTNYYEITFGSNSNKMVTLRSCVKSPFSCFILREVAASGLLCNDFREYLINWSGNQIQIEDEFKEVVLDFNFTNPMTAINFLTIAMGDFSGVWLFSEDIGENQVFLGAKYLQGENIFRWVSAGEVVNLTDWTQDKPIVMQGQGSLEMMRAAKRLSFAGDTQSKRFICQKSVLTHVYIVVVPGGGVWSFDFIQVSVTTDSVDHVYVSVVEKLPGSSVTSARTIDGGLSRSTRFLFNIAPDLEMRSSGVYDGYVSIRATREVTVAMFSVTKNEGASTLVPPVSTLSTSYFISSVPKGATMVSITALYDDTSVVVTLTASNPKKMMFGMERFFYDQPLSVRGTLNKYETLFLQNKGDLTGSFIQTSEAVLVLTGSVDQTDISTDFALDFEIPIKSMDRSYVTIPSVPLLSTEMDYFRVVAIFPQTLIKVFGPENYVDHILIPFVGDAVDVALPRNGFYSVTSTVLFYVIKITTAENTPKSVCKMSLLPTSLWKTSYDFVFPFITASNTNVFIVTVLQTASVSNFHASVRSFTNSCSCSVIEKTSLSGCYFTVHPTNNDTLHIWDDEAFAAYMLVYDGDRTLCHSLGAQVALTNLSTVYEPEWRKKSSTDCTSSSYNVSKNMTDEMSEVTGKLMLDFRRTSKYKRTLISVPDQRVSSTTVGSLGIIVVGCVLGAIVLTDMHNIYKRFAFQ